MGHAGAAGTGTDHEQIDVMISHLVSFWKRRHSSGSARRCVFLSFSGKQLGPLAAGCCQGVQILDNP